MKFDVSSIINGGDIGHWYQVSHANPTIVQSELFSFGYNLAEVSGDNFYVLMRFSKKLDKSIIEVAINVMAFNIKMRKVRL